MKKSGNILVKSESIPPKDAVMLNFTIHNNFHIEDYCVVYIITIVLSEGVFINEAISAPAVNLPLTF